MKMKKSGVISGKLIKWLCIILIGCNFEIQASEYFVAKNGSDDNLGTEEAPFLTIQKAASVMRAGDICFIKVGVYRETVNPNYAGTADAPITFKAFEDDSVVVTGTEKISNWQQHEGAVYRAFSENNLDVRFRMLYVNGKVMDIARWPNNLDKNPFTVEAELVEGGSKSHIESQNIPAIDWTGGFVWYLGAHSGTSWTRPINAASGVNITFEEVPDKWPFNPHNPTVFRNNNRGRFYLFGVLEALDTEEEWFYDSSEKMVYLYAPKSVNPNELNVEITARTEAFDITKDYIHIDGIQVFGARIRVDADYCEIRNTIVKYGHYALDELDNTDAQDARGSITLEGSYNLIENNLIEFGSANGISSLFAWKGSTNNVVHNNIIRSFNTVGIHSDLVRANTPNMTITNNTLYLAGRDGIYNSGANGEIAYNDVYDVMRINNDAGIFYTVGNAEDKNTVIHHNWFHDSAGPAYADGRAAGIYLDNHSKGYVVHHNMVWNITWSGIQINWDNWNIDIYNNSIYESESAMGRWAGPNGTNYTIDDIVIENNFASTAGWIGTDVSTTTNHISETSPFISFDDLDFRPGPTSDLIDSGKEISGITDGFTGTNPDIGAYEHDISPWKPGADWETYALDTSFIMDEEVITAIDFATKEETLFYPNPVSHRANISSAIKHYQIIDVNGKVVLSKFINNTLSEHTINLSNLPAGIYFLTAVALNDDIVTKAFFKQ